MGTSHTLAREHPNVDRGWAFPFLMASLVGFTLIFGISMSSAIFYVIFLESFQGSPFATAWVVGLNTCAIYIFLPINGVINKRVGDMGSLIIGTVLSSAGLIASMFAKDLLTLGLTFGIITGFGWASAFLGILHGMFLFFNRFRKLAVPTATLGVSFGQFVYPPLIEFLLLYYDWRGALMILAGLNLNLFTLVAIFHAGQGKELAEKEAQLLLDPSRTTKSRMDDLKDIFEVCKNWHYFLFNLSTVSAAIAVGAFQTHITRTSILNGHGAFSSAMLPSAIGASGLVGRLAWGVVAQKLHRLSVLWLSVVSYIALAVVVFVCMFSRTFPTLLTAALLFGFLVGIWALMPECMIAVVGQELFVHGVGINGLFTGSGLLIGPPFVGWLSESDPTYRLSFGISTGLLIAGAVLLLPSSYKTTCSKEEFLKRRQSEAVPFDL